MNVKMAMMAGALVAAAALAHGQAIETVVDLGHPLSEHDPSWDGRQVFSRVATATPDKDGFSAGMFSTVEHFGTHLDAPSHFGGSWTTDRIPIDRLVRPGVCINVEARARGAEDYQVTLDDVRMFESKSGAIGEGMIVMVATGWDRHWSEPARYMNVRDDVRHFPGISVDAATYLARNRKVAGVGIDTPSVDYGPSKNFEVHHVTMPLNVFHIENATRLVSLPPTGFTIVVAPINLVGGSGGPTRVFALIPAAERRRP